MTDGASNQNFGRKRPNAPAHCAGPDGSAFGPAHSSAALSDRELVNEILACLRINLMRGTLTTQDDNQLWTFIQLWSSGQSAVNQDL
jgi:hypothetical protein